jgi:hypothetical protein
MHTYNKNVNSISGYRELNKNEKEIIDALLAQNFSNRDVIKEQIHSSLVRNCCECGCLSIELSTKSKQIIKNKERIPVEADYYSNNKLYQILLHIVDGKVNELEFVDYDQPNKKYPSASELEIKTNDK